VKASGLSLTYSSHVFAFLLQELSSQTKPAHAPQKVVSMMICCAANFSSMSQAPANLAAGFPQMAGLGLSPSTSAGMASRGKKYTLMASEFHCIA
jgi:hypothetical protein